MRDKMCGQTGQVMTGKPIATLNDVLLQLNVALVEHDRQISGLALDSRKIIGGELFLAIPGIATDGRDYMVQACSQGASAILAEADSEAADSSKLAEIGVPVIIPVSWASGKEVGYLAKRYYSAVLRQMLTL